MAPGRVNIGASLVGAFVLLEAIALGALIGTTTVLPTALIPRGTREPYSVRGAAAWAWLILHGVLFAEINIEGELDLKPGEGALIVCNHRSWVDPLILLAYTYSNGLSKAQIKWLPFIGFYGWLAGAVFFERSSGAQRKRARNEVLDLIGKGHRVQLFPEGTRSRDGKLRERVHLTLMHDCYYRGHSVVCTAVANTEAALPPGRFEAHLGAEMTLTLGPTLRPADFESAEQFARQCWAETVRLVDDSAQAA